MLLLSPDQLMKSFIHLISGTRVGAEALFEGAPQRYRSAATNTSPPLNSTMLDDSGRWKTWRSTTSS